MLCSIAMSAGLDHPILVIFCTSVALGIEELKALYIYKLSLKHLPCDRWENFRHKKVKRLVQGHRESQWQRLG